MLEAENVDGRSDFEDEKKPEIEVKDLASILQKDELFQDYLENNRKRVQSAFQLRICMWDIPQTLTGQQHRPPRK